MTRSIWRQWQKRTTFPESRLRSARRAASKPGIVAETLDQLGRIGKGRPSGDEGKAHGFL
jgi:hypothetical protein